MNRIEGIFLLIVFRVKFTVVEMETIIYLLFFGLCVIFGVSLLVFLFFKEIKIYK